VPERRAVIRHQPSRELLCIVNVALGGNRWPARVADVSTDGIGILSDCWLPTETMLLIDLGAPAETAARVFLGHLRHATRRPSGGYHLGARLVNHLSSEQILDLVTFRKAGERP
jgi:hypothetical protein